VADSTAHKKQLLHSLFRSVAKRNPAVGGGTQVKRVAADPVLRGLDFVSIHVLASIRTTVFGCSRWPVTSGGGGERKAESTVSEANDDHDRCPRSVEIRSVFGRRTDDAYRQVVPRSKCRELVTRIYVEWLGRRDVFDD
jgi:hypothetical protein